MDSCDEGGLDEDRGAVISPYRMGSYLYAHPWASCCFGARAWKPAPPYLIGKHTLELPETECFTLGLLHFFFILVFGIRVKINND